MSESRDQFEQAYLEAAERAADIAEPLFRQHGWHYGDWSGSVERFWVPSWNDLRQCALRLLRSVGERSEYLASSGRFTVIRTDERTMEISLDLGHCDTRYISVTPEETAA